MLEIKSLEKNFGDFRALNGVNLNVNKGEIYGFVGPNGAGKSTTMKVISGLLNADCGEVYVNGIDAIKHSNKLKELIGYMPDFIGVYDNLKTTEYLEFYGSIYGITGKIARKRALELLDLVKLSDKENFYVEQLSRGMKQRLSLARAMMHSPKLLILDEPANGMDPRARFEMKNILKDLIALDKTIIVSSHILAELGEVCDRVGIIDKGVIVAQGTVKEIIEEAGGKRPITIRVSRDVERALGFLSEYSGVSNVKINDKDITLNLDGNDEIAFNMIKNLINSGVMITSFNKKEGSLEDLFIELTETRED